ncbi:hypothetical protein LCGC14_2887280, partial [marine sediment metagenome]
TPPRESTKEKPVRFVENVLPNPDFQLTLVGGKKIPQSQPAAGQ